MGRRFARVATNQVVRRVPGCGSSSAVRMRGMFDKIAPVWDEGRSPDAFAPVEAALERVSGAEARAGSGDRDGTVALLVAQRYPKTEVVEPTSRRAC